MKKIGIIGFGNMGSAIAERIKTEYQVFVFDKDKEKIKGYSGINVCDSALDLVKKTDVVVLAIKPQDFASVLPEIKDGIKAKLIISIAAGIATTYLEKHLINPRVMRVMPNLPARIGKGMICVCQGKSANETDAEFAACLFRHLGETLTLEENMMDAATAVCGSGPGFLYDQIEAKNIEVAKKYTRDVFIPSLATAATSIGFTQEQARLLAEITAKGSIAFLEETGLLPLELKKQVASKGGTTEAGLEVLHKGGSLEDAVKTALKRAQELSKNLP